MQALDGLFKEDMKHEKQKILEERKKRLSEMLLKETKEFEVTETKQITVNQRIMNLETSRHRNWEEVVYMYYLSALDTELT